MIFRLNSNSHLEILISKGRSKGRYNWCKDFAEKIMLSSSTQENNAHRKFAQKWANFYTILNKLIKYSKPIANSKNEYITGPKLDQIGQKDKIYIVMEFYNRFYQSITGIEDDLVEPINDHFGGISDTRFEPMTLEQMMGLDHIILYFA
ncbi:MAG: hypothetical protein K9W44_03695 [Candidatus Lokiarchaeota archaeon]|nr:hypothetical protein [Candidatus Harpocratesius repetitus]